MPVPFYLSRVLPDRRTEPSGGKSTNPSYSSTASLNSDKASAPLSPPNSFFSPLQLVSVSRDLFLALVKPCPRPSPPHPILRLNALLFPPSTGPANIRHRSVLQPPSAPPPPAGVRSPKRSAHLPPHYFLLSISKLSGPIFWCHHLQSLRLLN